MAPRRLLQPLAAISRTSGASFGESGPFFFSGGDGKNGGQQLEEKAKVTSKKDQVGICGSRR